MLKHLAVLILAFALSACAGGFGGRQPDAPPDGQLPMGDQGGSQKVGNPYKIGGVWYYPSVDPDYDEVGFASWYGQDFHGKPTANGETYNMNALTAAHKTLPMPSFVKVTNLENGRSIVLRVNDRGPFAKGRIIDISRRGAQLLGFERQGVTRVRVQLSDENGRVIANRRGPHVAQTPPEPQRLPDAVAQASDSFFVQVGSFSDRANALEMVTNIQQTGRKATIVGTPTVRGTFWRVRVGPFRSRRDAEQALDRLVADGFYEARVFAGTS